MVTKNGLVSSSFSSIFISDYCRICFKICNGADAHVNFPAGDIINITRVEESRKATTRYLLCFEWLEKVKIVKITIAELCLSSGFLNSYLS